MQITYGRADKSDIHEICRMADDVMLRYEDFSTIDREKAIGWTHLSVAENINNYAVIYANGIKAGYYLITKAKDIYELHHLFVFERMQNRGIGTAAVKRILEETNGNLQVFVYTGDISTFNMFENMGFAIAEIYHRTRYRMIYHPLEMEQNNRKIEQFEKMLDASEEKK